jgi:hypothetical protein
MRISRKLRDVLGVIQHDPGNRGLARDPVANLFNACPDDLAAACQSLAEHPDPVLVVVTGFWIPAAGQGETDGPLGAVYLARTLPSLGVRVALVGDPFCRQALLAGLEACGQSAPVLDVPDGPDEFARWRGRAPAPTHLLALERVGPSHTPESVRAQPGASDETLRLYLAEVPPEHHGRCHTMRGADVTAHMRDAAALFEGPRRAATIGVGDGGNEIGMGKVPWPVVRNNISGGAVVACRVATDHLVVAGVSNWGAYALASGVALVKGVRPPAGWFDLARERHVLQTMVEKGPLVDGVRGANTCTVDGLDFEEYAEPLNQLKRIMRD